MQKDQRIPFSSDKNLIINSIKIKSWLCCFNRSGCGYGSESEGEEPVDSNVTLPQNLHGRGNIKSQQSAIRLTEVRIQFTILRHDI